MNLEVSAVAEGEDLPFPVHEDRQGRSLHPADRRLDEAAVAGVVGGQGAGAVDADEPVAFGAAPGGRGEGFHLFVGAETGKGVHQRLGSHRLHPEALDGLVHLRGLEEVAEDQFTLAAGVAGVDEKIHLLAAHEFLEQQEALLRLVDRLELELLGKDGKLIEVPLHLLAALGGEGELDEVPDCGGNDVGVVLEVVLLVVLLESRHLRRLGQSPAQLGSDARLLRNDQCFSHRQNAGLSPLRQCRFREGGCSSRSRGSASNLAAVRP